MKYIHPVKPGSWLMPLVFVLAVWQISAETLAQSKNNHAELTWYKQSNGHTAPVVTPADWDQRRQQILKGMQLAMGDLPDRHQLPELDMRVLSEVKGDGFIRQLITFVSEPGDRIPALLYIPSGVTEKDQRPAMLALHPTGDLGKRIIAGEGPLDNRQYALELAQKGYVVLCPDYPSFGDYSYDFTRDRYQSGTMKGIFNHMRSVDLLESLKVVDPEKIGVIGHSLGGHNAMFVGVFDLRLKVIVSSCGWTPFHDYYGGNIKGWTSPRYMPALEEVYLLNPDSVPFDFYEVVAALAPRPFYSNSPQHDDNFSVEGVKKAIAEANKIYQLLGAGDQIQVVYPDCGHDFPEEIRLDVYEFIRKSLD